MAKGAGGLDLWAMSWLIFFVFMGTIVTSTSNAVACNHWTGVVECTGGLDYWTQVFSLLTKYLGNWL